MDSIISATRSPSNFHDDSSQLYLEDAHSPRKRPRLDDAQRSPIADAMRSTSNFRDDSSEPELEDGHRTTAFRSGDLPRIRPSEYLRSRCPICFGGSSAMKGKE